MGSQERERLAKAKHQELKGLSEKDSPFFCL